MVAQNTWLVERLGQTILQDLTKFDGDRKETSYRSNISYTTGPPVRILDRLQIKLIPDSLDSIDPPYL